MLYTKSKDTEENIDIYFTRPIGLLWARLFNRFGASPNTVTVVSIFLGVAAGPCFLHDSWRLGGTEGLLWNVAGILLLMWANFLDSADGQLARMTGKTTRVGRILDGAAENIWFLSIYHCLIFRLWPEWGWWGAVAFYFCGFVCHASQARMADCIRGSYLFFQKGQHQDSLDEQLALWHTLSWRRQPVEKALQMFYLNYTFQQERETPRLQELRRYLKATYGDDIPEDIRRRYLEGTFPLLKWTNFLTFNWRAFLLYASVLTDCIPLFFWGQVIGFTAVQLYMNRKHERLCHELLSSISGER